MGWVNKVFVGIPSENDLWEMVTKLEWNGDTQQQFYLTASCCNFEDTFQDEIPSLYHHLELYYGQEDGEVWITMEVADNDEELTRMNDSLGR